MKKISFHDIAIPAGLIFSAGLLFSFYIPGVLPAVRNFLGA